MAARSAVFKRRHASAVFYALSCKCLHASADIHALSNTNCHVSAVTHAPSYNFRYIIGAFKWLVKKKNAQMKFSELFRM
jgi:hypothetical protein